MWWNPEQSLGIDKSKVYIQYGKNAKLVGDALKESLNSTKLGHNHPLN